MQNGKGDKPRPVLNRKQYEQNWDEINWSQQQSKEPRASPETEDTKESFEPFPEPLE